MVLVIRSMGWELTWVEEGGCSNKGKMAESTPNDHAVNRILQVQDFTARINVDLLG